MAKFGYERKGMKLQMTISPMAEAHYAGLEMYKTAGAVAMDLVAVTLNSTSEDIDTGAYTGFYGTGLSFAIPFGYGGLILPRSSSSKTGISLANTAGLIDSDYRGEIILATKRYLNLGDRVAQMAIIPMPQFEIEVVKSLPETVRGTGGFGSTGN